jgi:hypothetical protein
MRISVVSVTAAMVGATSDFEMATGFLRFAYPDSGQATGTHPESNPNDSDSLRKPHIQENPYGPVPESHDPVPALFCPVLLFVLLHEKFGYPSTRFFKKGHFRELFLFCRFTDRGAFHSGLPGGVNPGTLSAVSERHSKPDFLIIKFITLWQTQIIVS